MNSKRVEKTYKDYPKQYIGLSDIASLTLRFCNSKSAKIIQFNEDNDYYAYVVTEKIKLPSHYSLIASGKNWLYIYDDSSRSFRISAPVIRVYRCGNYGVLIYAPNAAKGKQND